MLKKFFLVSTYCCFALIALAQSTPAFEATTNAKQVVENGDFEVSFTITNADGTGFQPPKFNGFRVVGGPNRSSQATIINGQATRRLTYYYTLMATKPGKYRIGAASIKIGGKKVKTAPIEIEVLKAKDLKQGEKVASFFVKAEVNTTNARVGQQISLDYKLYTTVRVESSSILYEPEYKGFFTEDINRFSGQYVSEVIDGVQYNTKILKRIALFPQQAGLLKIEAMALQLGVASPNQPERRGFFFTPRLDRHSVQTNDLEINVLDLPANPPASFTGAVGKYSMQAGVDKVSLTTDDAISLKMAIVGNGDLKQVLAPQLELTDSMEVYEPKVLGENTIDQRGEITGKKVIEYLLLPRFKGNYKIQPAFTYFDTDSSKFITLRSQVFNLKVRQGLNKKSTIDRTTTAEAAPKDLRGLKTETSLFQKGSGFWASPIFYGLLVLPFILLAGVFFSQQQALKRAGMDQQILKSESASKVAQAGLAAAKTYMDQGDSKSFYDEVSRASLGYVCDKLNIPVAELSKENVQEQLQGLAVNEENIARFMKILQTCEMALFAGKDNAAAMQETYGTAIQVITQIEEEITTPKPA
ncbi:MAG: BatD family protein [Saprospiraceae bacterium]